MTKNFVFFGRCFVALTGCAFALSSFAAQAPNPRSATNVVNVASQRTEGREVNRGSGTNSAVVSSRSASSVSRSAVSRPTNTVARTGATVSSAGSAGRTVNRSATTTQSAGRISTTTARSGAVPTVARSASQVSVARAGSNSNVVNASRAATARATAIFDDVSKVGGGYAACREAYATCMDQFCAKANDTYRRCFCSNKFIEFRDMEAALDEAKNLLVSFEDNNLNAVDKTAEEVQAMYSATEGEQAIKSDTSAAASMLSEIGDLLSGKKKATTTTNTSNSLGVLDFDFSADIEDIWGGGSSSIFDTNSGVNLSELEGQSLYNAAHKQCLELVADSCESNAVLTMATSAYNILITQDCNAYEKNINAKKETVEQTVRTAEKYLREARLEEYRSHNSADVNECISKVRSALTADTACGANYKRCMDYSGAYIDVNTGEPIYSPRLFELADMINLNGSADVLAQNSQFNSFLDSKRMFAETALDTCRDISDIVWEEFKRSALIEISQAQDAKIEEVKMSCVSTMAECYDSQTNALNSFDTTTAKVSGALSAQAARAMCEDKVIACAALYGGGVECDFDSKTGKITNANNCGLQSLLAFVDTVDTVRISEGCTSAIRTYLEGICTPTGAASTEGYPFACRSIEFGSPDDSADAATLWGMVNNRKNLYCNTGSDSNLSALDSVVNEDINRMMDQIQSDLVGQMYLKCVELGGVWSSDTEVNNVSTKEEKFYQDLFGGSSTSGMASVEGSLSYGACLQDSVQYNCNLQNELFVDGGYTNYNSTTRRCEFTEKWYKQHCEYLGGVWSNNVCLK